MIKAIRQISPVTSHSYSPAATAASSPVTRAAHAFKHYTTSTCSISALLEREWCWEEFVKHHDATDDSQESCAYSWGEWQKGNDDNDGDKVVDTIIDPFMERSSVECFLLRVEKLI